MNDEVHVIHQDPLAPAAPLHGVWIDAVVLLQANLYLVRNCYVLAIIRTIAYQEVVRQATLIGIKGENSYVFCLLIFASGGRGKQQLVTLNCGHASPFSSMIFGPG